MRKIAFLIMLAMVAVIANAQSLIVLKHILQVQEMKLRGQMLQELLTFRQ
jgi:hypothetical protein